MREPLFARASVAERVFYLASTFDGEFTSKQAKQLFKETGTDTCADIFSRLTCSGYVTNTKPHDGKKLCLYAVTQKGFEAATKFEKMIERSQRFIHKQENA